MGRTGHGRDGRAEATGQLDRGGPDGARCAIDEHVLAGLHLPLVAQEVQGRRAAEQDRGNLIVADGIVRVHFLRLLSARASIVVS